jgi:glycosyltransferase involved in cell wall biosynthesis
VFVAPFGLGQKTTVWARILPLAQHLSRQNIETSLLIPPWDTPAHAGLRWNDEGVDIDNVRLSGGPPAILARLIKRIRKRRPDIVHIVKPIAYAGAVQRLLWGLRTGNIRHKIILDIDDWEQAWTRLNRRSIAIRQLVAWQENWGMGHADGITAASKWLLDQVTMRHPHIPVCYIPNGITHTHRADSDANRSTPATTSNVLPSLPCQSKQSGRATDSDAPNILFFTRFMEISPAWLVAFCAHLFDNAPLATLTLAGSGVSTALESEFKTTFQSLADETKIDRTRLQWLGHIPYEALVSLYESTTCAIFPAQATDVQQAKCSVRLATTLLHGVPIVASRVGEQEHYGHAGHIELVSAQAMPQEFAAAVLRVLAAPDDFAIRQHRARERLLAEYNWANFGERLHQFYQSFF